MKLQKSVNGIANEKFLKENFAKFEERKQRENERFEEITGAKIISEKIDKNIN